MKMDKLEFAKGDIYWNKDKIQACSSQPLFSGKVLLMSVRCHLDFIRKLTGRVDREIKRRRQTSRPTRRQNLSGLKSWSAWFTETANDLLDVDEGDGQLDRLLDIMVQQAKMDDIAADICQTFGVLRYSDNVPPLQWGGNDIWKTVGIDIQALVQSQVLANYLETTHYPYLLSSIDTESKQLKQLLDQWSTDKRFDAGYILANASKQDALYDIKGLSVKDVRRCVELCLNQLNSPDRHLKDKILHKVKQSIEKKEGYSVKSVHDLIFGTDFVNNIMNDCSDLVFISAVCLNILRRRDSVADVKSMIEHKIKEIKEIKE
jgi:hypothetical protein